jgi:hypothetical protein
MAPSLCSSCIRIYSYAAADAHALNGTGVPPDLAVRAGFLKQLV